jgi:hypothetical protein
MMSKEDAYQVLCEFSYQVHNGGFYQYWYNVVMYNPKHLSDLKQALSMGKVLNIPGFSEVEGIVAQFEYLGSPEYHSEYYVETYKCAACFGTGKFTDYDDDEEMIFTCEDCGGEGEFYEEVISDGEDKFIFECERLNKKFFKVDFNYAIATFDDVSHIGDCIY